MIYNQWAVNQIVCIIRSFQALLITYLPHVMNAEYADLIVFFSFWSAIFSTEAKWGELALWVILIRLVTAIVWEKEEVLWMIALLLQDVYVPPWGISHRNRTWDVPHLYFPL